MEKIKLGQKDDAKLERIQQNVAKGNPLALWYGRMKLEVSKSIVCTK